MVSVNLARTAINLAIVFTATMGLASSAIANPSQRIVGGQPILIDDTPSIVALLNSETLQLSGSVFTAQFCGGTLIDSSWVLTAAHCVISADGVTISPDDLKIVANSHDLNNITSDPVDVAQIIVHEGYELVLPGESALTQLALARNDIALLQLASPVAPLAEITSLNSIPVELNEVLVTAGWGARQFDPELGGFDFADTLHAVALLGVPSEFCNTSTELVGLIAETMVCAGVMDGSASNCFGDSGGPLYRLDESGTSTLVGVVSGGRDCGLPNSPTVYSDVLSFDSWIRSNMQPLVEGPVEVTSESTSDTSELTITSNPEDGSTTVVIPSLTSLSSGGGSAGMPFLVMLAGFIAYRRRLN